MPERRLHRRWSRRVRVNFWRRDHPDDVIHGYTSDLSRSGAFVSTEKPVGRNGRVQLQMATGSGHYLLEGVVARSIKVHKELQRVKQGGMGIRFLRVDELVGELLKTAAADLSRPSDADLTMLDESSESTPPDAAESFEVDLSSRERFLRLWDQDIRLGGLFVETGTPSPTDSSVDLYLSTPETDDPWVARAKVVQVFEPGSGSLLTGMGVVLVDADDLLQDLEQLADRLRKRA